MNNLNRMCLFANFYTKIKCQNH
uniref:Uncharacterized protein n=1 Tax=Arundo donax TaxID=35708 RepID=A0A0A9BIJ5_ARUDO